MDGKSGNSESSGLGIIDSYVRKTQTSLCDNGNLKTLWGVGIAVVALISIITVVVLSPADEAAQATTGNVRTVSNSQGFAAYPQAQQPSSMLQPAALTNSIPAGCVQCPNVTNCFPNASTAQPAAFSQFQQVGLQQQLSTAPPIFRDALPTHNFRGVCSNCHTIQPDIAIRASATLPHAFRGVCSNCHTIVGTAAGAQ